MNMRCEASRGWAPDPHGQPRIRMCGQPAKFYKGFSFTEVKLCDDCYEKMKHKQK